MKKPHTRSGRKYPRRSLWIQRRNEAFARADGFCEVSGEILGFWVEGEDGNRKFHWTRACDHIYPERFVRKFCPGADPHVLENLIVVTPGLHARKTAVEWRIFRGDLVGYKQELNRLGFDLALLDRAITAICASVKKEKANAD
jgi:hypothetical protein